MPNIWSEMKAVYLTSAAGPEGLVVGEVPETSPKQGEVLVEIHATAVTPTEFSWSPTFTTSTGEPRAFPIILSHEFSGVVSKVGGGVAGVKSGDEVFGLNDWYANGAQAQYCVAPATSLALKPKTLDHATAAVVPISALTAWQGLFDQCRVKKGDRVLVHGGAGGVGLFAVQLAHWSGAYVLATASGPNVDFVRSLGADEVVDYKTTPFETRADNINVIFDTVGGETLARSWGVLREGGRLVTVAAQEEGVSEQRVKDAFFIVKPNQAQLAQVARLLDSAIIRAFVQERFPLERTREAYARAARGGMRGKVAIEVRETGFTT